MTTKPKCRCRFNKVLCFDQAVVPQTLGRCWIAEHFAEYLYLQMSNKKMYIGAELRCLARLSCCENILCFHEICLSPKTTQRHCVIITLTGQTWSVSKGWNAKSSDNDYYYIIHTVYHEKAIWISLIFYDIRSSVLVPLKCKSAQSGKMGMQKTVIPKIKNYSSTIYAWYACMYCFFKSPLAQLSSPSALLQSSCWASDSPIAASAESYEILIDSCWENEERHCSELISDAAHQKRTMTAALI